MAASSVPEHIKVLQTLGVFLCWRAIDIKVLRT